MHPLSNRGATLFTLVCLSFPLLGVKLITGIPNFLNSYVKGSPEALDSIMTVSGFQYLYCSIATLLSSGNSNLSLTESTISIVDHYLRFYKILPMSLSHYSQLILFS